MDYVVGSIAALLSGNVTPNRPKHLKKAQTPIKHQPSPNVTPKSEFVEDRSIFLSPTMIKKKDIIKKSPKRIFENPGLDVTNGEDNDSIVSPKAEKVKKILKDNLEASSVVDTNSVRQQLLNNNVKSPKKANKKRRSHHDENITPKKKKCTSDTENDLKKDISTSVSVGNSPKKKVTESKFAAANGENSPENGGVTSKKMNKQPQNGFIVEEIPKVNASEEINNKIDNQSPKKKNRKRNKSKQKGQNNLSESMVRINPDMVTNEKIVANDIKVVDNKEISTNLASVVNQTQKKKKKKRNKAKQNGQIDKSDSTVNTNPVKVINESAVGNDVKVLENTEISSTLASVVKQNPKKKNRKRNKSKKRQIESTGTTNPVTDEEVGSENFKVSAHDEINSNTSTSDSSPKKKNKKNKSKQIQSQEQTESTSLNLDSATNMEVDSDNENDKADTNTSTENQSPKKKNKKMKKSKQIKDNEQVESTVNDNDEVNPNAITNEDTDSEHDSDDDEMDSENEEINKEALDAGPADDSSDEEADKQEKKPDKKTRKDSAETSANLDDETKRTLFVGNVPFSSKCKKEIKKIFNQYGQIESVRIRTVPVKDARDTPKLAVIKNEIHPDRTNVNVYVRFAEADSVEKALAENNSVLNGNHLRVQASACSGAPHDAKCSVFVGNLPFALEEEALRTAFERCGAIDSVRIVRDRKTCAGKGIGYVNFKSKDGVELALALPEEDLTIKNRILRVKRCTQPTQNQLAKKEKFNEQKQPNRQDAGNFGRGKFGGRPNDRFGGRSNERFVGKPNDRFGGKPYDRFGGKPNDRFVGKPNDRFGGKPNDRFGGKPNDRFGGKPNDRFGGKPNDRFGGKPNDRFGGRPNDRFGKRENFRQGNQGNQGGSFGKGKFGDAQNDDGAYRRVMNKRKSQDAGNGPPHKRQDLDQPPKEKKERKEFVGMTAEKKKKNKFDKGLKKKKILSEILTK